jgi:hypothetical protein
LQSGKEGLTELAGLNRDKAEYAKQVLIDQHYRAERRPDVQQFTSRFLGIREWSRDSCPGVAAVPSDTLSQMENCLVVTVTRSVPGKR